MSLANGRTYLALPGPSVVPDRVQRAMHRTAPDIYTGELVEMLPPILDALKSVARTRHEAVIYVGNGHSVWEAALANVLAPGDMVLVLVTGVFGRGWADVAKTRGCEIELMDFGAAQPVDPARVEARLREDTDRRIRAVLLTHVDTSTGVLSDPAAVRQALDATDHPALLMADCIASLACDRFEMDDWGVDVMIAASQKGLMTPPGLGFLFYNDRAEAARGRLDRVSRYWDWRPRCAPKVFYHYFAGTPPTHHLYGLREALAMIGEEGLPAVWNRHARLARAVWAAVDAWSAEGQISLGVDKPGARSHAVTCIRGPAEGVARLRDWVTAEAGVTLGIGIGPSGQGGWEDGGSFRIGHMGHVNAHMILGLLGCIEAGLTALDIPHGNGGVDAAVKVVAGR